jgi:hypothetical protein
MSITREALYAEIWAAPMTKIAAKHGASSNYLARVCDVLQHSAPGARVDGRGLQMSSVVRSYPEVLDTSEQWRAAMLDKGWN